MSGFAELQKILTRRRTIQTEEEKNFESVPEASKADASYEKPSSIEAPQEEVVWENVKKVSEADVKWSSEKTFSAEDAARSRDQDEALALQAVFENEKKASEADVKWSSEKTFSAEDAARSGADFEAALKRIQEFAASTQLRSSSSAVKHKAKSPETRRWCQTEDADGWTCIDADLSVPAPQASENEEASSSKADSKARQQDASDSGASSDSDNQVEAQEKRNDLKNLVQELYFKLIKGGMDPNAAAARAILEAGNTATSIARDIELAKEQRRAERRRARRALHGCGSSSSISGRSERSESSKAVSVTVL